MDENEFNKILEKTRQKIAISEFKEEKQDITKGKFGKMVASIVLILTLGATGVYAGAMVSDEIKSLIWKEPKSYTITQELSDEEKTKCITEQEAEKIGNDYLKQIGLTDEEIKGMNLTKDFFDNENVWCMNSEKATIEIIGETGKIKSVQIPTWNYKIPYNYGITRDEARKVAWELLEKYKPTDDTGEYEMVTLRRNMETDEGSYIWYAEFYKKYGNLLNESEKIYIGWIPTINALYTLKFKRNEYENNEEKITKEQAIKIAKEKEKQIEQEKVIKDIKAEIRIKQMNEDVYLRENFKEDYNKGMLRNYEKIGENSYRLKEDAVLYKTEERVRKVWVVVVEYDEPSPGMSNPGYSYYVDCTTGEIIGGEKWDILLSEQQKHDDQYNFIEK